MTKGTIMAIKDVLKHSEKMQKEWVKFPELRKNFHLRATCKGVQIISNHFAYPMRGVYTCISNLGKKLSEIKALPHIDKDTLRALGFNERNSEDREALAQVDLINHIQNDDALKEILGAKTITFIGSELVLKEGKTGRKFIPDVVAWVDGKICFVELKSSISKESDNKTTNQVAEYVEHYSNLQDYFTLINNYLDGDYAVTYKVTPIEGIVMYGYNPNKSPKVSVVNGIKVIRYEE